MNTLAQYAAPLALAVVALVLAAGLWNMMRGGSANKSQKLMRARVLLQFLAIIVVLGTVWLTRR
ncbi:MAG: twin transmembrane helix small protein [Alphaproteobacteria bacterium]